MSLDLRFSNPDWERIERDWGAWWENELDRPLVVIERLDGYEVAPELIPEVVHHAVHFPLDMPAGDVIDFYSGIFEKTCYYGDAFPRFYADFGPGFAAAFLGATLSIQDNTVWIDPAQTYPIHELKPRYDPDNIWWHRIKDLTKAAVEIWEDQVTIAHSDLGGNLDILASLHTTSQVLMELIIEPDEIERVLGEITQLWMRYFQELNEIIAPSRRGRSHWAQMWAPGSFYMLQSDLSYMISPDMFERFVLPDLQACIDEIEYPFYHLDGKGQINHLDHLLGLEKLRGIQWISGAGAPPAEEWIPLLKRIRDGGKLCQVYVTPQGAQKIVRELGGKGFCFVIFEGLETNQIEPFLGSIC